VSEADAAECARRADSDARRAEYNPAPATVWVCDEAVGHSGRVSIGVTGCAEWGVSNLESVRQDAYERAMKDCLRRRGYALPE
jgi:hypothetical protein